MKKGLKIAVNIVAWIVLVFAILVTILVFSAEKNNDVSSLFGFIPMTIESDSMKPEFQKNDLVIVTEIEDTSALKKGDVITFWTLIDGYKVKNTHRIVEVIDSNGVSTFKTQGDNNPEADELTVSPSEIIGKWNGTKLSGFGKIMNFLKSKNGFLICIIIPMALFFLFELYKLISVLIELKKPKLTSEDEEEIKKRAIEEYLAEQQESNENKTSDIEKAEKDNEKN